MPPSADGAPVVAPLRLQLLKWVGNKQRFAHEIAGRLPDLGGGTYFEPFLGSGAVLGTLAPARAVASDAFAPLVGIWQTLHDDPDTLTGWYVDRWQRYTEAPDRVVAYEQVKASYNAAPNPADLLFLSRACYGGVVRFRKADGHMSTPCGVHRPIAPDAFAARVAVWRTRTAGAKFEHMDYREALALAADGDVVYCDPPYTHTQTILYGAQAFRLAELLAEIAAAKRRGARVALSIDGSKKSGDVLCNVPLPPGLFEREVLVNVGRSMLRRFQLPGGDLRGEGVVDRLLLTY
ncbi:DNA adenine methylase [Motilibacter deserti]|uniref:site-specific DNA-methyltransferase (adenine-specific) n=1 Tax=Motilibacter deserti TaxID=2714956 RepID=A0ABX0GSM7_9ACTN|nr:DNA adenine methylase [Motilibacter deserti]NHC13886.1 DNA adenine methylase [Motilibacter deserti]